MATTVSITRFANGEPDQTGVVSVTMADVTNTYGLRRDIDGAVILAPGAPTTNPSEGVYAYDYGALALDPTQSYTASFRVVDGFGTTYLSRAIAATESRRTLRAYRRALAGQNQLGPYALLVTTADAATADQLVIGALSDADRNEKAYQGTHALIASGALGGQQRRVKIGGFSAASGTLTMSRSYSGLCPAGSVVELHGRLPAIRSDDGRTGINDCINWALEVCPQVIRLEMAGATGQFQYGLDDFPWLTDQVQVGAVYDPVTNSGENPLAHAGGGRLRLDAETPLLELDTPYSTGQTFTVELAIPGDRWIKTGGAWGRSDRGLVSDDDEALVDRRLVEQVALAYAYRALAGQTEPKESDYWLRRAEAQERRAGWIRYWSQGQLKPSDHGVGVVGGRNWPTTTYSRGWV